MLTLDWRLLAFFAILVLWMGIQLSRHGGAWRRSRIAHQRSKRALRGEQLAELLLEREGYEIIERQLTETWTFIQDGNEVEFQLRADLLVRKDDRDYIAEVKTGESAPDLRFAATRRQLLEYAVAYDSPIILLVDVERNEIHEIEFPI